MLAHRKRGLTPFNGPVVAPSVGFPAFPRRRERLPMHFGPCRMTGNIAGASSPNGESRKIDLSDPVLSKHALVPIFNGDAVSRQAAGDDSPIRGIDWRISCRNG